MSHLILQPKKKKKSIKIIPRSSLTNPVSTTVTLTTALRQLGVCNCNTSSCPSSFTFYARFQNSLISGQFPSVQFAHTFDGTLSNKKCEPEKPVRCDTTLAYRTIDGSCNNFNHPKWGGINQPMRRLLPAQYFDGN